MRRGFTLIIKVLSSILSSSSQWTRAGSLSCKPNLMTPSCGAGGAQLTEHLDLWLPHLSPGEERLSRTSRQHSSITKMMLKVRCSCSCYENWLSYIKDGSWRKKKILIFLKEGFQINLKGGIQPPITGQETGACDFRRLVPPIVLLNILVEMSRLALDYWHRTLTEQLLIDSNSCSQARCLLSRQNICIWTKVVLFSELTRKPGQCDARLQLLRRRWPVTRVRRVHMENPADQYRRWRALLLN